MTGAYGTGADNGAVDDDFSHIARDLERTGEALRHAVDEAAQRTYEVAAPDGLVTATVDGRPRLTALYISPYALRGSPDDLDSLLTATLNEALNAARTGSQQALLDGLPPSLRPIFEAAREDER
ncbi:MAG TPA: YbaB/EbfC family nucleoid-associated protein [Kribbellaceae bacterium]|nr:YbaB/EbfC family nucleoid-associated protein [Kribbellaceae bacterium]